MERDKKEEGEQRQSYTVMMQTKPLVSPSRITSHLADSRTCDSGDCVVVAVEGGSTQGRDPVVATLVPVGESGVDARLDLSLVRPSRGMVAT